MVVSPFLRLLNVNLAKVRESSLSCQSNVQYVSLANAQAQCHTMVWVYRQRWGQLCTGLPAAAADT